MAQKWHRLGVRPVDVDAAIAAHRSGRLDEARQRYERILATDSRHVTTLHFLGVLQHQTGDSAAAIATIERALSIDPGYADAHNNLGNVYRETNQFDAAMRCYQRVVELVPAHADAWNNLGVMLRGRGLHDEADRAYARAIELNSTHVAAWQNRASLLSRRDEIDTAVAAYRRVLELRPRDTSAYDGLSRTLYRGGRIDEAVALFHEWLAEDPGNPVATHMLAACTGGTSPARASDAYVRDTFDAFAGSFDRVLDQLGYRAPALIGLCLDLLLPVESPTLQVADAGCGTGLCAEYLRPRARHLVGVDLSTGMLSRARTRRTYDELVEAELTAWLDQQPPAYDLIISADTLCYFGALEKPLAGAASALVTGGLCVFTVEHAGEHAAGYRLEPSGRYSHADAYLREVVSAAGLELVQLDRVILRQERGAEVHGLLVAARHPAA